MGSNKPTQIDYSSKEYRLNAMRRFFTKAKLQPSGCIEWQGTLYPKGYGMFSFANKNVRAHRQSFMWANGICSLTPDQFVCHSCDNPKCVNPEHLWLGNNQSNTQDSANKGRHIGEVYWRKKSHCRRGHEFNAKNTYMDKKGMRRCRICNLRSFRVALKQTLAQSPVEPTEEAV